MKKLSSSILNEFGGFLVRAFMEVETGKGSDALERRPQLTPVRARSTADPYRDRKPI